ncbi:MAG: hypothetical protein E7235_01365 [Lachnospiraceae bacterium]|nr:hypothetical protein [Lachnospiraceae bacterium]
MYNDKETISANEINKFSYCPYQWYYERLYGRKKLRELELERNERLGLEDRRMSNLIDGFNYHSGIRFVTSIAPAILKIAIPAILIALIVMYFKVRFNV